MALHLLMTTPDAIDFRPTELLAAVEGALGRPAALYRPHTFVEHTGFSETVRDEVELVFSNSGSTRSFEDFIAAWDLGPYVDRRVLDLSGGWRKLLGLALFLERPIDACLLLDATSHLSDARVRRVLTHAAAIKDAVFCEYDPALFESIAHTAWPIHRFESPSAATRHA